MSKEKRRQDLLRAARDVFADKGFHEAKVGDIAAAAKVAKGTVYLYFPDKRSIFVELIDGLFVRLSGAILRVDTGGDVVAQIKHNLRAILSVFVDDPATMRMFFAHANGLDPSFTAKIDSFYVGLKQLLVESLREGQELGLVKAGDAGLYASFTLGALKEVLMEATLQPEGKRSREAIVEAAFELLQSGYLRMTGPALGGSAAMASAVSGVSIGTGPVAAATATSAEAQGAGAGAGGGKATVAAEPRDSGKTRDDTKARDDGKGAAGSKALAKDGRGVAARRARTTSTGLAGAARKGVASKVGTKAVAGKRSAGKRSAGKRRPKSRG